MSEEQSYQWTTEYDAPATDPELEKEMEAASEGTSEEGTDDLSAAMDKGVDEAFKAEIQARIKRRRRIAARKKRLRVLAIIVVLGIILTMCGGEIIRLKAENYALRKQQAELKAERDRLAKELETVGDKEYIKDQARKQLRLLDPGEIMFVFDDGKSDAEETANTEENGETGEAGTSTEESSDKN
ncbi:MAG: septum formation initiator family protein [Mogibacterium sp.]|nr:septum formation initiator family protein [Mogibacterium sp.]